MRVTIRVLAMFLAATWTLGGGAAAAGAPAEICPMGGTMIRTDVIKDKALAWAASPRAAAVSAAEADDWYLYARSGSDRGIGIMLTRGFVFFGVAGRGGEVFAREMERVFGKDLGNLRLAVRNDLEDLMQAGVVTIDSADRQRIADAVGLGALEKTAEGWVLKTRNCQAVNLPLSGF